MTKPTTILAPSEGETTHYGRPMKGSGDPIIDAMRKENKALREQMKTHRVLDTDGCEIPAGYREITLKAYTNGKEIVVPEQRNWEVPGEDDPNYHEEDHNCDQFGCSSVSHVVARGRTTGRIARRIREDS